jgi:hypothetical protein
LVKTFLAFIVSNSLKLLPFNQLSRLLNFCIAIVPCSSYSFKEQRHFEVTIRKKYKHVSKGYLIKKFTSYPYVLVISKQGALRGLMFINYFEQDQENYLYVGPIFFISKLALCFAGMSLLEIFSKKVKALHLLAEVQNPEMIIHLHSVMPEANTSPQMGTFCWTDQARSTLDCFTAHIKQIDKIDKLHFKSKAVYSLFKERNGQKPILDWLRNHGVDLAQGDSLVMLSTINMHALPNIRKKVWYFLLTYPAHRIHYLQSIQHFVRLHSTDGKLVDHTCN